MNNQTDPTTQDDAGSPANGAAALLPIVGTLATPAVTARAVQALKFVADAIRRHPAQSAVSAVGLLLVARKLLRERRHV